MDVLPVINGDLPEIISTDQTTKYTVTDCGKKFAVCDKTSYIIRHKVDREGTSYS